MLSTQNLVLEDLLSGLGYIFFYFFIFYYLITLVTGLVICKISKVNKWFVGQLSAILGYCAFRFGDIIDGDFLKNFTSGGFLSFIILGFFIKLIIEKTVIEKLKHKT